jgi:hypothetical protein
MLTYADVCCRFDSMAELSKLPPRPASSAGGGGGHALGGASASAANLRASKLLKEQQQQPPPPPQQQQQQQARPASATAGYTRKNPDRDTPPPDLTLQGGRPAVYIYDICMYVCMYV